MHATTRPPNTKSFARGDSVPGEARIFARAGFHVGRWPASTPELAREARLGWRVPAGWPRSQRRALLGHGSKLGTPSR
jgi:hypothetical protein